MSKKRKSKKSANGKTGKMNYFKAVKSELSKVVYPGRETVIKDTGIVLAVCAVFALLFWGINTGTLALFSKILG